MQSLLCGHMSSHSCWVYLQRSIIVPPELGYGKEGLQEIPPNGTFELEIELLSVG